MRRDPVVEGRILRHADVYPSFTLRDLQGCAIQKSVIGPLVDELVACGRLFKIGPKNYSKTPPLRSKTNRSLVDALHPQLVSDRSMAVSIGGNRDGKFEIKYLREKFSTQVFDTVAECVSALLAMTDTDEAFSVEPPSSVILGNPVPAKPHVKDFYEKKLEEILASKTPVNASSVITTIRRFGPDGIGLAAFLEGGAVSEDNHIIYDVDSKKNVVYCKQENKKCNKLIIRHDNGTFLLQRWIGGDATYADQDCFDSYVELRYILRGLLRG